MAEARPIEAGAASPLEIRDVHTRFGAARVHQGVSLEVRRGEVFALAGASGCGKSTLLREIIMLHRPERGSIRVLGQEVTRLGGEAALALLRRVGVMFERGALFGALTVAENVGVPLREHTRLAPRLVAEIPGRDLVSGLPKTLQIGDGEIRSAVEEPVSAIVDAIKATLDRTPPELAGDIMHKGITLTGGGALLRGFDKRLRHETGMPVYIADNPLSSVAIGSGKCLEEFEVLQRVLVSPSTRR